MHSPHSAHRRLLVADPTPTARLFLFTPPQYRLPTLSHLPKTPPPVVSPHAPPQTTYAKGLKAWAKMAQHPPVHLLHVLPYPPKMPSRRRARAGSALHRRRPHIRLDRRTNARRQPPPGARRCKRAGGERSNDRLEGGEGGDICGGDGHLAHVDGRRQKGAPRRRRRRRAHPVGAQHRGRDGQVGAVGEAHPP